MSEKMSNFGGPKFNLVNLLFQAQQILKTGGASNANAPGMLPSSPGSPILNPAGMQSKVPLAMLFGNDSLRLNPQETSTFLKDVLKFPQEIRLILLMLALESSPAEIKKATPQNLKEFIEQNMEQLAVSPDDVQALLTKNAGEATDKLIKLLQSNQMSQTRGAQQIAELAGSLGKLSEKIKASPQEALETLMLLYIPWYPLTTQQKLELSFELGEGGEEGGEKDVSAVVYLETNTLGRFKILVYETEPLQVVVTLFHEDIAKPILPTVEKDLNESLATEGLPAAIFNTEILKNQPDPNAHPPAPKEAHAPETAKAPKKDSATAGFEKATRQADQKQITVQQGQNISLLVLNTAYTLARLIFEADEGNRTLQRNK